MSTRTYCYCFQELDHSVLVVFYKRVNALHRLLVELRSVGYVLNDLRDQDASSASFDGGNVVSESVRFRRHKRRRKKAENDEPPNGIERLLWPPEIVQWDYEVARKSGDDIIGN